MLRYRCAPLFAAGLALLVRTVVLASLAGSPLTRVMVGDSRHYLEVAARMSGGLSGEVGVFFLSAPLYPLLLSPIQALVEAPWLPVVVLQAIAGSLACAAIAATAGVVFPDHGAAPWIAGFSAALYAPMVYFDMEILPASLATSLVAFVLLLAVRTGGRLRAATTGALIGASALLAPALILIAPFAAVGGLFAGPGRVRDRSTLARAACMLGAALAVVSPVTIHNLLAGDLVLISSSAGVNAFIGNNPQATGSFLLPAGSGLDGTRLAESAKGAAEREEGRPLSASEVSAHWMGRARTFVATQPGRWVRLMGRKVLLTINHYELPNHLNFQFVRDRFAPALGWALPFWLLLPFAALGSVVSFVGRSRRGWMILGTAILCLAVPVLFFATARYRLPAAPAMLVLGGGAVAWLFAQLARRRWIPVAGAIALIVPLIWTTRLQLAREGDYSLDHLILGHAYRELGELDQAIGELKLAIETESIEHDAWLWLATVYEERGNVARAVNVLVAHLELRPGDRAARGYLSRLRSLPVQEPGPADDPLTDFEISEGFVGRGDFDNASRALMRAIDRDPAHVRAIVQLAWIRVQRDDLRGAFDLLRRAVRLDPSDPVIWKDLARIYHRAGNVAGARQAAERALQLDPLDAKLREVVDSLVGQDSTE